MEESGTNFGGINNAIRKKRTQPFRRPRPDSQALSESYELSPLPSTPSDDVSKISSDENGCDVNPRRKEFNLNQGISRPASYAESEKPHKRSKKEDGGFNSFYNNDLGRSGANNKRSSEGVLAPANWKSTTKVTEGLESDLINADVYGVRNGESHALGKSEVILDGLVNENKVKKVKLKVGGVTRTIHSNSTSNGVHGDGFSTQSSLSIDDPRSRQKQNLQNNLDCGQSASDKRRGLQGIPWKDFSSGAFSFGKEDSVMGRTSAKNASGKQGDLSGSVRKSKRVPKRRVLDGEFSEEEEDDEIRYLEKLKFKAPAVYKEDDEESGKKHRKLSAVSNISNIGSSKFGKDGKKKSRSDRASDDTDYDDEDELVSESELEGRKKKRPRKELVDSLIENKREMTLTTRQRALQSSKDASAAPGSTLIEFPNGLPPAPPRKQKEKLSEVEQQLKKTEAAQRRRVQVEKAARESEAEAIRKILGQESSRKKREEKIKKRLEELAQEKAANALMLGSNTIRTVSGPEGNTVTFSKDMGLPSIFDAKPCSYPPPREKCAGPSCTNSYKYRDSKSKLPLCSLKCYKAIQEQQQAETTS